MLHLVIIGIVCAISAPNQGTTFIGRKNNESIFCRFYEGEQNIAKVSLPSVYNVDVCNSSDYAKRKLPNRTSSFFYNYIIKQYQNIKNSSCSIVGNVFLEKEKNLHSNVDFPFRKRNLLWTRHNSKFSTKTLRPPMEEISRLAEKPVKVKKPRPKTVVTAAPEIIKLDDKCGLNSEQKRMLFRLKNAKHKLEKEKLYLKHLDKVRVVDALDLNKRIEKLARKVSLENQRKENNFGKGSKSKNIHERSQVSSSLEGKKFEGSFPFFNRIKKLISFSNNDHFKTIKRDVDNVVNSFPVNKVPIKDNVAEKTTLISDSDILKTERKTTRIKRNPYNSFSYLDNPVPIFRQNFFAQPYPYSANFVAGRYFLYPPVVGQIVPGNERIRRYYRMRSGLDRGRNNLESWPFFKKLYSERRNMHDSRLKRHEKSSDKPNERLKTEEEDSITATSVFMDAQEVTKSTDKTCDRNTESTNTENNLTKENDCRETSEEIISSSANSFKDLVKITTANPINLSVIPENKEDVLPDHTLEKPFLGRGTGNEKSEYFEPNSNFEKYEPSYNLLTDSPIFGLKHFPPVPKYKYELRDNEYLNPYRFLKIRHALRNYLIHNNVWSPSKRHLSFDRRKRCGRKSCSMPRKCWRSAPLLCVPYIKKGQEDVLKYLIRVMQDMMGKPLPPKVDIFEKTKFKPCMRKAPCDNIPEEEIYECESTNTPSPCPEMCPPPPPPAPPPPQVYCPRPKPCSCPTCPLTSKVYGAPPYLPNPNIAKLSPDVLRPFSYANFNPLQQCQCPVLNSWPSEVPLFAPHMNQMAKQNPAQGNYEGKLTATSSQNTLSTPTSVTVTPLCQTAAVPTTPLTSITSAANISHPSQIKVSVPVYSNASDLKVAQASYISNPTASNLNVLPSQSAATTVATFEVPKPTVAAGFEITPSPSTRSACALYVSNSPVGQEEYFSYTAFPYDGAPECATVTDHNTEMITSAPLGLQPVTYNQVNSQKLHCDACFGKVENASPNTLQMLEWLSTTNLPPATRTIHYQSQRKETPKIYKEVDESSQEKNSEYNQFRKGDRNGKFDSSKNFKKNSGKTCQYDDSFQNDSQMPGSEISFENPQKRLFRMRHYKKISKPNTKLQPTEFLPPYDYYTYDKYPLSRPHDFSNMKLGKYPVPQLFWNDYGGKIKTLNNPTSLLRRKRGDDYYFAPDNLDNYNDYLDDSSYNDESSNKNPEPSPSKIPSEDLSDSGQTPSSYDMFSELAKAVSDINTTMLESANLLSSETTASTYGKSSTNVPILQNNDKSSNLSTASEIKITPLPDSLEADGGISTQSSFTSVTVNTKSNVQDRVIDSKKTGRMSFFQTSSKIIQTPKNSKKDSGKEEKESEGAQDVESAEEGQIPTTLKPAIIVKGQKKILTKPSPKVYSKVYPDSLPFDFEINDTTTATVVTTVKGAGTENRTALLSSTPKPDIRLQLLAVCEGYLEIVKLIKAQNQTIGGDLDVDLARYCENIISQSFNTQMEKPKKPELNEFSPQSTSKEAETGEGRSENVNKLNSRLAPQSGYENAKEFSEARLREKIVTDIIRNPLYTKKTAEKTKQNNKVNLSNSNSTSSSSNNNNINNNNNDNNNNNNNDNNSNSNNNNNDNNDNDNDDDDDYDSNENENGTDNNSLKKNEEERNSAEAQTTSSTEKMEFSTKKEKKNNGSLTKFLIKKQRKRRRKEETEEDLLKKGLSKEQIKMIQILRKRKKALLSWLFNLKYQDESDEKQETDYFNDEEDLITSESEPSKNSGTIKPKRDEKKSGRTKKNLYFDNASDFPVYAKQYGYDKGGELREVEVLWRKINEKTHEEKIFKNLSVLALFMTSTNSPNVKPRSEETKIVVNKGDENEDVSEIETNNENSANLADNNDKTTASTAVGKNGTSRGVPNNAPPTKTITKSTRNNATHTFISKPDPSLIVGESPNPNKARTNTTRKTSRKMEVAKDIFQEYTIEFLNYAVYILPIMFTIIFLFCCLCCALHILKTQQSLKRYRKKRKKPFTTDETSDSTTEGSECRSKKKKREVKFKRKSKSKASDVSLEKGKNKKFWSALKLPSKYVKKLNNENSQTEKKKNFLRFLRGEKRDDSKENKSHESDGAKGKEKDDDSHRTDDHSETTERRELIALLEELKKIEMEHMGDKKEVNSVHVQYMTQEEDNPVYQRPDVFCPYQKNVFGMPKGYSFCNKKPYVCEQADPPTAGDCELCEDVNELTELLPCECNYFSKKNDCLRHSDFGINRQGPCERFLKIFRDSGVYRSKSFKEKNLVKNECENRSFIFNKYRTITTGTSDELMGVSQKNAGTEVRLMDNASSFALASQESAGILEEIDNLKCQLNRKKNVRLKDDGVLCRL